MKRYKVRDILNMANKKYSLYFDQEDKDTQINTYTKQIRKVLKNEHGYKRPFDNIKISDAYYLVDYELKDYFIANSVNRSSLEKDELLAQKYEEREKRMIEQQGDPYPDDALSHEPLDKVIDNLKDDEYDPISKLKEICSKSDDEFSSEIEYLDKLLHEFKQNYIFYALLKMRNEQFDQKQFIKDYFERNRHIDDRTLFGDPMYGYSKYNDKIKDPINHYIYNSKNE